MIRAGKALVCGMMVAAAACGRGNGKPADSALSGDLSLAAQQRAAFDSLSPAERSALTSHAAAAHPVSHTHRASGGSVANSSGGTTTTTTTSSGGTVEKHTQRDAAIGAAAGAVIGATSSKNKVKGGLIGAAVGGILGGVIGNNVDKKKKP